MNIKYEIGQTAWWATCNRGDNFVECPDCGGTGRLRVTFHDDTTVSIACQNCAISYDPPTGRVKVYDRVPKARPVTVIGFEVGGREGVEYRTSDSYIINEDRLFDTQEAALECASVLAAELDCEGREHVLKKEKNTRSWAWNASYHRREIKQHQEKISYHESKLAVAALKAKPLVAAQEDQP